MTIAAEVEVLFQAIDQITPTLTNLDDRIRYVGARMRNAGIGMTIAFAPLAMLFKSVAEDAMEFEQMSTGISTVAKATGRDLGEVMSIINKHSGEMASKIDITRGTLKLLSTDLTNVQIEQFIQLVKDGAAAMGEDFGTQLPLVTRGFKQLNPNVIDNIGINIRMKEIYKKANVELKKSTKYLYAAIDASDDMSEAQKDAMIEQILFNEMQRKGAVYSGVYSEYMNTTSGKVATLTARLKDFSLTIGTTMLNNISNLVGEMTKFVKKFEEMPKNVQEAIGDLLFYSTVVGGLSASILMLGGNLVWSIGQITHLKSPWMIIIGLVGLIPYLLSKAMEHLYGIIIAFYDLGTAIMEAFKEPIMGLLNWTTGIVNSVGKLVFDGINEIRKITGKEQLIWKGVTGEKIYDNLYGVFEKRRNNWEIRLAEYRKDPFGIFGNILGEAGKIPVISDITRLIGKIPRTVGGTLTDIGGFYSNVIQNLIPSGGVIPTTEEGATTEQVTGGFNMPTGTMGGNFIINIYTPAGEYGSMVPFSSISSLMENVGNDTVINAGTVKKGAYV